jgi:hypothetical protein
MCAIRFIKTSDSIVFSEKIMAIQKATVGAAFVIALIWLVVSALGANAPTFTIPNSGTIIARMPYSTPSPDYSSTGNWTSSIVSCLFTGSGANITVVLFKTNVTGTWSSWITLIPVWVSGTDSCWGNYTLRLPSTVGTVVGWKWTAKDANNNWLTGNSTSVYTLTTTAYSNTYSQDAVLIGDADYDGCKAVPYVLQNNMTALLNSMQAHHIKYAIVLVSYVEPGGSLYAYNGGTYEESTSTYNTFISGCHSRGIKAIAWLESAAGVTLDSATISAMTNNVEVLLRQGWDGYCDDMEWTPYPSNYVSYINNMSATVHEMGKLFMPTISANAATVSQTVTVDFNVAMFYSVESWFEYSSSQTWNTLSNQMLMWSNTLTGTASPVMITIMSYYGVNLYPLAYQLNQTAYFMKAVTHSGLYGFCLWQWECTGYLWKDDWQQWDYFYSKIGTSTPVVHTLNVSSSPSIGISLTYQNGTWTTPTTQYSFNVSSITISAPSIATVYTYHIANGTSDYWADSCGWSTNTYYDGPMHLPAMTITAIYIYCVQTGNIKVALYTSSSGNPSTLVCQNSSGTSCTIGWNLIKLPSTNISAGYYFVAFKPSSPSGNAMVGTASSEGYGGINCYYTSETYSTSFASTAPAMAGDGIGTPAIFVPSALTTQTTYYFSSWTGGSTSTTLTFTPSSNTTIIATYSTS